MDLIHSWAQTAQERSKVYDWLADLFAQELPEKTFLAYCQGDADDFLAALSQIGLAEASDNFQAAIADLQQQKQTFIDLKADFAHLFLLDGKEAALPYASYYLEENHHLYGAAEARMRHFLQQCGLKVDARFKEPADHLAVYLALMGKWAQQDSTLSEINAICHQAHEQARFLQEALLSWLPEFVSRCQQVGALSSQFYPALAVLLLAFVKADQHDLQQQKP